MSEYLAQELVIEILRRLPINSIIRCICVCKSWYSLITNPSFISLHLNKQDDYLLVRHCTGEPVKEYYDLFYDNENFDQYAQFDVPFECPTYFNIMGNCNGLLCLYDNHYNFFYLWNPSIRKSIRLPKSIFPFEVDGFVSESEIHVRNYEMLGFGFDSITNDYKVVRIAHTCRNIKVDLYKLSTGVWQDITLVAPFYDFFRRDIDPFTKKIRRVPGVYVNGACHWVASKRKEAALEHGTKESQNMIVLFDVHDEMFREIMLPVSLVDKSWTYDFEFVLFVSKESLCLANSLFMDSEVDIWMMKGYGDPESWVKQFCICRRMIFNVVADEFFSMLYGGSVTDERQVTHYLFQPMASRKNGDILWRAYHPFLVSYEPAAGKIKCLCIHNITWKPFGSALYVNTYKQSLVLLDKQTDYSATDTCEESADL